MLYLPCPLRAPATSPVRGDIFVERPFPLISKPRRGDIGPGLRPKTRVIREIRGPYFRLRRTHDIARHRLGLRQPSGALAAAQ